MNALGSGVATETDTVAVALVRLAGELARAGIENARLEARLLLAHVLECGAGAIIGHPERALDAGETSRLDGLARRRRRRQPMAQILGRREFWSLDFRVTGDTLTPRPESETVVEAALGRIGDRDAALRIVDFGTGSGCLLLALLSELPGAFGLGVDLSPAALAIAGENAAALGLAGRAAFVQGDWGEAVAGPFDIIVANPPYIATDEFGDLAPEVRDYEPRLALSGGDDGLSAYRRLIPRLPGLIADGGAVALEIGGGEGADRVTEILAENGLKVVGRIADLAGTDRCLLATL